MKASYQDQEHSLAVSFVDSRAWLWPDAGSCTTKTTVTMDQTYFESSSRRVSGDVSYTSLAPRTLDFSKVATDTSMEALRPVIQNTFWYCKTAKGGFYDYYQNYNVSIPLPTSLSNYIGLPTTITIAWTATSNIAHAANNPATFTLDVADVLVKPIVNFVSHQYMNNGYMVYFFARVSGFLKTGKLGRIQVWLHWASDYEIESKNPVTSFHAINANIATPRVVTRMIAPAGRELGASGCASGQSVHVCGSRRRSV